MQVSRLGWPFVDIIVNSSCRAPNRAVCTRAGAVEAWDPASRQAGGRKAADPTGARRPDLATPGPFPGSGGKLGATQAGNAGPVVAGHFPLDQHRRASLRLSISLRGGRARPRAHGCAMEQRHQRDSACPNTGRQGVQVVEIRDAGAGTRMLFEKAAGAPAEKGISGR